MKEVASARRHKGSARGLFVPVLVLSAIVAFAAVSFLLLPTIVREMATPPVDAPRIHPGIGKRPAAFALAPLTGAGKPTTLQNLAGNVTVVNFWGTWCGPCRTEFPELVQLGKELGKYASFRLFLISCGDGGNEEFEDLKAQTEAFVADIDKEAQTHWDPEQKTRAAFQRVASMQGLPVTFVLDREGVVRGVWPGYHTKCVEEIRHLVLTLLTSNREASAMNSSSPASAKTP